MQEVQIRTRGPLGMRAHWRFGYLRRSPLGLNFVARTELLYFPTTFEPFAQSGQMFAIGFLLVVLSYHSTRRFAIRSHQSCYTGFMIETLGISHIILTFLVVIFSIILHEVAHGYAAYVQGDETAHRAGRLTLNPLPHIDMVGSVIVPLLAFFTASTFFGWAKPVPYNVYNIRTKLGHAFVAAAGILTNLLIALIMGIAFKVLAAQGFMTESIASALFLVISVNVSLAFFNLIPVPPFDGMAIIQAFFPRLHINQRITFNPLYMIAAILIASTIFSMVMPPVFAWIFGLLA